MLALLRWKRITAHIRSASDVYQLHHVVHDEDLNTTVPRVDEPFNHSRVTVEYM